MIGLELQDGRFFTENEADVARRCDLHRQFLFEAVAQGFVGGLLGVLLGWLVALAVGHWSPFPARVTPFLVTTGLAVVMVSLMQGFNRTFISQFQNFDATLV